MTAVRRPRAACARSGLRGRSRPNRALDRRYAGHSTASARPGGGDLGGIDSSVCAALAVRAHRAEEGIRPAAAGARLERVQPASAARSSRRIWASRTRCSTSRRRSRRWAATTQRDEAIRRVFPAYGDGWKNKIVIAGGTQGGINFFKLVVRSPDGETHEARLPLREYLQIVAATNFKQRVRKTMDYFHADRLNYAVVGTPNRLEYDQGFFVKVGDGAADLKPIAHLYKTQVYAMARSLGLPEEICNAQPTTDTYTLAQGQDEFYFALPYPQMDLALWSLNHGVPSRGAGERAGHRPKRRQRGSTTTSRPSDAPRAICMRPPRHSGRSDSLRRGARQPMPRTRARRPREASVRIARTRAAASCRRRRARSGQSDRCRPAAGRSRFGARTCRR